MALGVCRPVKDTMVRSIESEIQDTILVEPIGTAGCDRTYFSYKHRTYGSGTFNKILFIKR